MNRNDFSNVGGHPLTLTDIKYVRDVLNEFAEGSLSHLLGLTGNDVVILSGCIITEAGGNFTHTEGFVWITGELYYVAAKVVGTPINTFYEFNVAETVDPAGTKTYYGGGMKDTRFTRTCTIVAAGVGSATTLSDDSRLYNPRRVVGDPGEPAYSTTWGGIAQVRRIMGRVEIEGQASIASMGGTDRVIWVLDLPDWPPQDKHFIVKGLDNGVDAAIMIKVDSGTGEVSVVGGATGVSKTVYLNSLYYYMV